MKSVILPSCECNPPPSDHHDHNDDKVLCEMPALSTSSNNNNNNHPMHTHIYNIHSNNQMVSIVTIIRLFVAITMIDSMMMVIIFVIILVEIGLHICFKTCSAKKAHT